MTLSRQPVAVQREMAENLARWVNQVAVFDFELVILMTPFESGGLATALKPDAILMNHRWPGCVGRVGSEVRAAM